MRQDHPGVTQKSALPLWGCQNRKWPDLDGKSVLPLIVHTACCRVTCSSALNSARLETSTLTSGPSCGGDRFDSAERQGRRARAGAGDHRECLEGRSGQTDRGGISGAAEGAINDDPSRPLGLKCVAADMVQQPIVRVVSIKGTNLWIC
jgi:hypothetical protein